MLDLESHEQEIDAANNHILEMVLGFGVFEFDMQAVLDADVHLDRAVILGWHTVRVHPQVLFPNYVRHAPRDGHPDKVAQLDVDAIVRLVLLFDVLEIEWESLRVEQLAGRGKLLDQGKEFIMVASIVEHLCIPKK